MCIRDRLNAQARILECILGLAVIIYQQGDSLRSAQLVGFINQHPAKAGKFQNYLEDLLHKLEGVVSSDVLTITMEEGVALAIDRVVPALLDEFSTMLDLDLIG